MPLLLVDLRPPDRARSRRDRRERAARRRRARPGRRDVVSRDHRSRDRPQRRARRRTERPLDAVNQRGNRWPHRRHRVRRRSPLARYAPLIAVVVVIAIVAVVIGIVGERQDDKKESVSTDTTTRRSADVRRRPDLLQRGEGQGHARQVHVAAELRHDDRARSRSRSCNPPPCVPAVHRRQRRRDVAGRDRRHDQDRVLHREARPAVRRAAEGGRRVRPARRRSRRRTRTTSQIYAEPVRAVRAQDRSS